MILDESLFEINEIKDLEEEKIDEDLQEEKIDKDSSSLPLNEPLLRVKSLEAWHFPDSSLL